MTLNALSSTDAYMRQLQIKGQCVEYYDKTSGQKNDTSLATMKK